MTDVAGAYANDPELQKVSLGIDAVYFLEHDKVGRYLYARALNDRAEALEALGEIPAHDQNKILELQWKARVPNLFLEWLSQAITEGRTQEELIAQQEGFSL
jgi:hypothetical protein